MRKDFNSAQGYSAHRSYVHLYDAAQYFVENRRTSYDNMAALTMSCFLLEGYLKFLNAQIMEIWPLESDKSMSLIDKVEQAHKKLGLCFEPHSARVKTLKDMVRYRNTIAHPTPIPTSFLMESLEASDSDLLKENEMFMIPTGMDPQEAWDNGIGHVLKRDEVSHIQIKRLCPTGNFAKKVFESVVQTIEGLDAAALKKAGLNLSPGYNGPFSATDIFDLQF